MRIALALPLLSLGALLSCARATVTPSLALSAEAHLAPGVLTVALPMADSAEVWLAAGKPFHWRISGAGAPMLSYELEDSVARRSSTARERLVQGEVSRCEPQGHILMCGWRLPTRATWQNGRLIVQVRDSLVAARWVHAQPAFVQRGVWQGPRRIQFDSVTLSRRP